MATEELSDVLSEFARTMATDFPIQGILDHLVRRIVEILPVGSAGVTLISAGVEPRYVAASDSLALRFEQLQTELDEGPCLAAFDSGHPVLLPDLQTETRFPRFAPRALEAGLAAAFTFPLNHGAVRLGSLDLYRQIPGPLSAESMAMAQTLADVAAAYLVNAQARADLQESSDRSREAALHDSLTGLPNRVLILERLEQAFRRARRSGKMSAVLFVDLDRFKAVNDAFGHRAGDELLVAVAERLTEALRPGDTLARLFGDEFVIVCEDLSEPSDADVIAARVDAALALPFVLPEVELNITASIGIAFTGHGSDAPEQMIHDADLAMYRAKRQRVGERQLLDLRELHLAEDQASLKEALPSAAQRGELHLAYQPIVAAADGRLRGAEALLRWTHPSRGPVPPTVLIPIAEKAGLICEIGSWVLDHASMDRKRWHAGPADDFALAVNVSAHQLMSAGFVDTVEVALQRTSTDPGVLTLEITESVFVRDADRALFVLNDLKDLGVRLALDDFGTGYSSLNYLTRFPVDAVKVDRAFTADLEHDPASLAIVTAVIGLAHDLGMTVVSEGVESAEQHHLLTELGCDYCQGFYFARPMPILSMDTLVHHPASDNTYLPARSG